MPQGDLLTSNSRGRRVTLCIGRMRNDIIGRPPHSGFLSICFKVSLNKGFVVLEQDKKAPLTLLLSCRDFPAAFPAREAQRSDCTAFSPQRDCRAPSAWLGSNRDEPLGGGGKALREGESTQRRGKP